MKARIIMAMITMLWIAACHPESQPIQYGREACAHCKMTIIDKRFAAEVVTSTGKIFKFDATECMAGFLKTEPETAGNQKAIFLVSNYDKPGNFIDARHAFFLYDSTLKSPMGGNLAAFQNKSSAETKVGSSGARIFTWNELLKTSKTEHTLQ